MDEVAVNEGILMDRLDQLLRFGDPEEIGLSVDPVTGIIID